MDLFQFGEFTLSSVKQSKWKIDCDALTDDDIETLAWMVKRCIGSFFRVEGIPRGGLRLARALEKHASGNGPMLLVDDVLTSGRSMIKRKEQMMPSWVVGAVLFARGPVPHWITPVFQSSSHLW